MNKTVEYKGYTGSVEFSQEDRVFYGRILGIRALVSYEGTDAEELLADLKASVDDYLASCEESGVEPERPFKGSFNVRISPELHMQAALAAIHENISLNSFVARSIERAVADSDRS